MSIQQGVYDGFVNLGIKHRGRRNFCSIQLADDTGKASKTIALMDAGDCRNLAGTLLDYAVELEEEAAADQPGE